MPSSYGVAPAQHTRGLFVVGIRFARPVDRDSTPPAQDLGRNLFAFNRANALPADQGGLSISCGPLLPERHGDQEEDFEYALPEDEARAAPHEAKDA